MGFVEDMKRRKLVAQTNFEQELADHCNSGSRVAYAGFDPTADSLHIGHLIPVMTLARWQKAGHKAVALMGGGTALIGDPTGKTDMRKMLNEEMIHKNIAKFEEQVKPLLDFSDDSKGKVVNNADWLTPINYLDFLREFGVCFSVNRMLTAECFKSRLEKGLSFLEFNYMLLQAYDFYHLFKAEDCTVQLGGDDQWSNILAGSDLIRRKYNKQAYCLTVPLLTTSEGKKMGKTEKGAVWIDPNKTSPYEYFQYWRNVPDDMVGTCLRFFTFLETSDIEEMEKKSGAEINQVKVELAFEATAIIHGEEEAKKARESATQLFSGGAKAGTEPVFSVERSLVENGVEILELLTQVGVFPTKSEGRRLIQQGGVSLNDEKINDPKYLVQLDHFDKDGSAFVKKGKKHYYRLEI